MLISFVEIQNFRKLKSVRIDFSEQTTLFVGANNSGKTSATLALRSFLSEPERFTTNDFTLSNWPKIEKIAAAWEAAAAGGQPIESGLGEWDAVLPSLDVWLDASPDEIRYLRRLLPSLDWAGGPIGVRIRLQPKDPQELYKDYLLQRNAAVDTLKAAQGNGGSKIKLWPEHMCGYLERKLHQQFEVRTYLLNAVACKSPVNGIAMPQDLPKDIGPLEGNPLSGLIRVDPVPAQRAFRESSASNFREDGEPSPSDGSLPLSGQLRAYYKKHLDPSTTPEPADLIALEAIEGSQSAFNERLTEGFKNAIKELEELNYPGVADPRLKIATMLRPVDGLRHNAAVQYELGGEDSEKSVELMRLPEDYNGLGYQHLISIVFRLMAFRDSWMRVGKANKAAADATKQAEIVQPLHLVIVEEPEAHLHPQVQQVFVHKAYEVLRNNETLKKNPGFKTQLIVSTHSSHIAHETQFACLRYFRRMEAIKSEVPFSAVINLTAVFGKDTEEFVARYIRASHCDLFFADGVILVEGDAERMLVPLFIREHFPKLYRCYITLMQVGGSHAHRLRALIEHLGLTTLIITDVDPGEPDGHHKFTPPQRGAALVSNNYTLTDWHPGKRLYDELLAVGEKDKIKQYEKEQFSIRVAYQLPVMTKSAADATEIETLPATFEDSLLFSNLELSKTIEGGKLLGKVKEILNGAGSDMEKCKLISGAVRRDNVKAEFALDILMMKAKFAKLAVPKYIHEGLAWLESQLDVTQKVLLKVPARPTAPALPEPKPATQPSAAK
jgi:predicted ATP-dependent endonuclease of OLD family